MEKVVKPCLRIIIQFIYLSRNKFSFKKILPIFSLNKLVVFNDCLNANSAVILNISKFVLYFFQKWKNSQNSFVSGYQQSCQENWENIPRQINFRSLYFKLIIKKFLFRLIDCATERGNVWNSPNFTIAVSNTF
jgi:hypothetical protein